MCDENGGAPGTAGIPAGSLSIPAGSLSIPAGSPSIPAGSPSIPAGPSAEPKGWYSRGYLPHVDQPNLYQSITFRLADSVPAHVVQRWQAELCWQSDLPSDAAPIVALRRRIVAYEDAGHGACWLNDDKIATLVQDTLLHFDGQRYHLIAWCIMPNHVHTLVETFPGHPLDSILHTWKSFSAQQANRQLARKGPFWARDYYDRYIRDDRHFAQTVAYIEQNPVKVGLVKSASDWKFSSASHRT